MEAVRSWLTSLVTVSMLLNLTRLLTPKGSVQKIASFTGGLILLLALLRPLMEVEITQLASDFGTYQEEIRDRRDELEQEAEKQLERSIAERTSAYISDKAKELGAEVSVRIKTASLTEGLSLPAEVEITGAYSPELAAYIERDLGIPAERQVWSEDEN